MRAATLVVRCPAGSWGARVVTSTGAGLQLGSLWAQGGLKRAGAPRPWHPH